MVTHIQLHHAITEFVADLQLNGRVERTVEGHKLELLRLARWIEEQGLEWSTLQKRELQRYARLRADKGHSSRSNMFCTLRTFYRWAVEQGYVALSPAAHFKTPKKPHPQPRALTKEQVAGLIRYLRVPQGRRARRDEALMLTALYSGLRAKELATLRWSDIDMIANVITIELSKMGHGRTVTLHPSLRLVLEGWQALQGMGKDAPVFSLDGVPISGNRVGKIARRIRSATGLPLTTHVLRHTFATWALRGSHDLYAISKALGHKQLKQTEIYVSADVEDIRGALDTLPELGGWEKGRKSKMP